MDPSRGDSRYNLNYSMSSIGLSLAEQADMYGNPAAVAALSGRPPSTGLLQSMSSGVGMPNVGIATRSANIMSAPSQCQPMSNSSGHSLGQQRGVKRSGSECYEDANHRVSGGGLASLQAIDSCSAGGSLSHSVQQQQQQSGSNVGVVDNLDDNYSGLQSKKSPPANGKKTKGRVKIKMEYIDNKLRRYTTFSKRKTGIMKKAYELSTLTGTQVMLLVASETGHVYTFATRKLQPMITSEAGKQLIQTCLNSPDPPSAGGGDQRMSATGFEETELSYNIADEDSKDLRSSSSVNDSEESSDVEGSDTLVPSGALDKQILEGHNNNEYECSDVHHASVTAKSQHSYLPKIRRKSSDTADDTSCQSPVLSNATQNVILQLIESGHLQVHTEEDGSGLQYVAIPISPATAEMIQFNKSCVNATLLKSISKNAQDTGAVSNQLTLCPPIKEEFK